jgi:hypothetical protein
VLALETRGHRAGGGNELLRPLGLHPNRRNPAQTEQTPSGLPPCQPRRPPPRPAPPPAWRCPPAVVFAQPVRRVSLTDRHSLGVRPECSWSVGEGPWRRTTSAGFPSRSSGS